MKKYIIIYLISFNIFALQILEGPDILSQNSNTDIMNLARAGDIQSQFKLANMYHSGDGVEKNDELSFYWYKEVANKDYPSAQFNIANSYYKGIGVTQDIEKAIVWYTKAANAGLVVAMYNLAFIFKDDKEDPATSFQWSLKAANLGNNTSQLIVANSYAYGIGVEKDPQKATKWFELSIQSDTDNTLDSKYNFAKFLTTQKEDKKALLLYQQAADAGSILAQYNLAKIYLAGEIVKKDQKKAIQLLTSAANDGYGDAQQLLASKYYEQKLYKKAAHWYQQAADNNNPKAQYSLGIIYLKGLGIKKDIYKSTEFFIKAAQQDYVNAQYSLAMRYLKGDGIKQNYYEAVKWLKRAAKNQHANAQYSLSLRYKNGEGVTANTKQRIFWLQQSSKNNNKTALYELSALTLLGESTGMKKVDAVKNLQQLTTDNNLAGSANYALGKFFLTSKPSVAQKHLQQSNKLNYKPALALLKKLPTQTATLSVEKLVKKPIILPVNNTISTTKTTTIKHTVTKPIKTVVQKPAIIKNTKHLDKPKTANISTNKANTTTNIQEIQSMYRLAIMYLNNSYTSQDFQSAFMLMEKIAIRGFPPAQNDIALMYLNGLGVNINIKKAYYFANLAFTSGYLPAGQTLILVKNAANKSYQP